MAGLGALCTDGSAQAREPWVSAGFLDNRAGLGLAITGTDYYLSGGEDDEGAIRAGSAGVWLAWKLLRIKAAGSVLSALDIYTEEEAFVSLGVSLFEYARIGADVRVHGAGLQTGDYQRQAATTGGVSAWVPFRFGAGSFRLESIPLEGSASPGFVPPVCMKVGLHSRAHDIGALGMVFETVLTEPIQLRLLLGQELRLHKTVAVQAGFGTNPVIFSIGLAVTLPRLGVHAALARHPLLGWSRAMGSEIRISDFGSRNPGRKPQ
jgi:hypothetical protein